MTIRFSLIALALAAAGCSDGGSSAGDIDAPTPPTEAAGPEVGSLEWATEVEWRSDEDKARDVWRNPAETLAFFEVENSETVVEIWPGGGWYSQILGAYLNSGGGTLIAAGFDIEAVPEDARERIQERIDAYAETFVQNPLRYGNVEMSAFSEASAPFAAPDSVDTVLTFRNVHNWMGRDYSQKFFEDAFVTLKPGGILGVVEHRLPSSAQQDPRAASGYVHEDFVKALAAAAGFEFVAASEINANRADTADHPFGVWTLPPRARTADRDGNTPEAFDPQIYLDIGESDRMTLKFKKPLPAIEPAGDLEPVE